MASERKPSISDTELQVLQVLWDRGASLVREVREELEQRGFSWAYNTVQTLLVRLAKKGFVHSRVESRAHRFEAARSRELVVGEELQGLADRLCDGSPKPLVQSLLGMRRFTAREIRELQTLLDGLQGRTPGKSAKAGAGRKRRQS